MGIAISMLMITAGAVMRFAVSAQAEGWNVHTAGVVLIIVGVVGAVLSIAFWASWGGFRRFGGQTTALTGTGQRTTTVREHEVV